MPKPRHRPPIIYTYLFAVVVLSLSPAIAFAILHLFSFFYPRLAPNHQIQLEIFFKDRIHFTLYLSILHAVLNWLLIFLFVRVERRPLRPSLNLRPLRSSLISLAVYSLGMLAMSRLLVHFMSLLSLHSHSLEFIHTLLQGAVLQAPVLAFTLFSIIGPITEELLFRGYIQPRLIRRHGPFLGILITSILFGIYHHDLVQGIYAAGFGLFIGAVSYRSSSILPAIVMHMANNSLSTLEIFYPQYAVPTSIPILIGATIILPASVWLLCNNRPNPPLFPALQPA